jgi:TolB-like protein
MKAMQTLMLAWALGPALAAGAHAAAPQMLPTAVLPFQEAGRGVAGLGEKVGTLLTIDLLTESGLWLVERTELDAVRKEAELNLSGMVNPAQAMQVGQLSGAKILVTGSVIELDRNVILAAKIIGTETGRVLGAKVTGAISGELAPLVTELAAQVAEIIRNQAGVLVAAVPTQKDQVEALNKVLGDAERPVLRITVAERHVGQATIDPAAQTELTLLSKQTGFRVLDPEDPAVKGADIVIAGEAFSEFAVRRGDLISVKARVEVTATDQATGEILVADRQTAIAVDLAEHIAGKAALQEAAAVLAARILPKLVSR